MKTKATTLLLGLLSCGFAENATHDDQDAESHVTQEQSRMSFSSRLSAGIESGSVFANGDHGYPVLMSNGMIDTEFTGPTLAFNQDFTYCGIGFVDATAKISLGVSEVSRNILDFTGYYGANNVMHTRTIVGQVGMRIGADLPFNTQAAPMRLRPFLGFTYAQFNSKVIAPTSPLGHDFYLFKLSFYRPAIGLDWMIEGPASYLKLGFGYEFPWASLQNASPSDGLNYLGLDGPKNRLRSSRGGLQATLESGVNITSGMKLFGLVEFYSVYARGGHLVTFGDIGDFEVLTARAQSLSATLGLDFTY